MYNGSPHYSSPPPVSPLASPPTTLRFGDNSTNKFQCVKLFLYLITSRIHQAAQKCPDARHARIEQRSVLFTYVSSENRSITPQMGGFQQPANTAPGLYTPHIPPDKRHIFPVNSPSFSPRQYNKALHYHLFYRHF